MVLLLASFYEFTLFLKIVLWIAIPLIIVSFTVTTILHYRQKKKNALKAANDPGLPVHEVVDLSLVARLQKEVLHYKRRIKELQHALSFAKEVIPPAAINSRVASLQKEVEILTSDPILISEPGEAGQAPDIGYLDLQERLTGSTLLAGSTRLTENTSLGSGSDFTLVDAEVAGSKAADPAGADQTNMQTMQDVSNVSSAYLQDLVNEQKTHVLFLQQQLESRIKSFHELEFQFRDTAALLEKMTLSYEHVKHQLDDNLAAINAQNAENETLRSQVARLESSLSQLQDQHNQSLRLLDNQPTTAPKLTGQSKDRGVPAAVKVPASLDNPVVSAAKVPGSLG